MSSGELLVSWATFPRPARMMVSPGGGAALALSRMAPTLLLREEGTRHRDSFPEVPGSGSRGSC